MAHKRQTDSVYINLLGHFEVRCGDALVIDRGWNRRKAAALLKLLALQKSRSLHREQVLEALWPDLGPQAAASNFRKNLHYLRRALSASGVPAAVVAVAGNTVALSPEVRVDVDAFLDRAEAARTSRTDSKLYKAAVTLCSGDLLPEDLYEAWTEPHREKLRSLRVQLLTELSRLCELRGDVDGAIAGLEQLLQADPLQEDAHRSLMRVYAQSGDRQKALRQYRRCREILSRELAVDPSEETEALRREIVEGRLRAAEARVQARVSPLDRLAFGVFVGREREMERLRKGVEGALSGRGNLVLLGGEPGIGKTRLSEELSTYASLRGARVLSGRCYEEAGAPAYWPWMQIIRSYVEDRDPKELMSEMGRRGVDIAQVVPELRDRLPDLPAPPTLEPEQARFRLFDSISAFLKNASARQPLLLILDDLHWADEPSLLLLQFLARDLQGARLLVLGAYRDVEVDGTHTLSQVLGTLLGGGACERQLLGGLGHADVRKMVTAIGEQELPEPLVEAVYRHSEGNPFFILELLKHFVEEGKIRWQDGRPTISDLPGEQWGIPEGVHEVIRGRLSRLSHECRRVLSLASATTGRFSWELLSVVSEVDEDRLLDLLDEALAAQVVRERSEEGGAAYEFTHALIRQTLYHDMSKPRRARLHHKIGESIERLYAADVEPHLAEIADHFCRALPGSDVHKAVDCARRAADRARAVFAYEEAVRLYQMALQALGPNDRDDALRCDLLLEFGNTQMSGGDFQQGRETLLRAAEIARRISAPERLAAAAVRFGDNIELGVVCEPLVSLLEEALSGLGEEKSSLRAKVLARLSPQLHFAGALERAILVSREAVAIARRSRDPDALAHVLDSLMGPDTVEEQLDLATEVIRLGQQPEAAGALVDARLFRLRALMELGDVAAADGEIQLLDSLASQFRRPWLAWWANVLAAMRAFFDGRLHDGEQLSQRAFAEGQSLHAGYVYEALQVQILVLRWEQGRLAYLEPALAHYVAERPAMPAWRCALALLYSETGQEQECRREFEPLAVEDFAALPRDFGWLAGMALLSIACAFLDDRPRAAVLYDLLAPYARRNVCAPQAIVCLGSAARYLGLLSATMRRWDDAARHFEDAAEMNARMGARPYLAHTQHEYANMLLARGQTGDHDKAAALLDQALATARELGMSALENKAASLKLRTSEKRASSARLPHRTVNKTS